MANRWGVKYRSFRADVRKSTGETPHQFVLRQRLARAKAMCVLAMRDILDVAVACGFKTSSILHRSF